MENRSPKCSNRHIYRYPSIFSDYHTGLEGSTSASKTRLITKLTSDVCSSSQLQFIEIMMALNGHVWFLDFPAAAPDPPRLSWPLNIQLLQLLQLVQLAGLRSPDPRHWLGIGEDPAS